MTETKMHRPRHDRGFTLIELMVAVTIGLALTIVVATLFLHSRSTYGSTDEVSRMQENIRFAHQLLSRIVEHAGYMDPINGVRDLEMVFSGSGAVVIFDAAGNPAFTAADGVGNGPDGFPAPDSLTVRFNGSGPPGLPDGSVVDCQGRELDATQVAINIFTVKTVGTANGGPALFCNNGVADVEVVPDVENMQLMFGEDTMNSVDGSAIRDGGVDRYVPMTQAGAGAVGNVDKIITARIALLFRTANPATVVTEGSRRYSLNGVNFGPFTDKRIRRVVNMTVALRNRVR